MFSQVLLSLAQNVIDAAVAKKIRITTAESCTGGLLAACLTELSGASAAFDRCIVTYSNDAKTTFLGVSPQSIARFGAVSAECAKEMAEGVLKVSNADIAVSITGIAGPTGGSEDKPIGLVYIAVAKKGGESKVSRNNFEGDRSGIRLKSVEAALGALLTGI